MTATTRSEPNPGQADRGRPAPATRHAWPTVDGDRREVDTGSPAPAQPAPAAPAELAVRYESLLAAAARAPSIHNTQPWRFRIEDRRVELYADPTRQLAHADPDGREMLLSCGAALFGVRLGVRHLGYRAAVELLPDQSRPDLLARVNLGAAAPLTSGEQQLLAAVSRRHTHRGAFAAEPLPAGLLATLGLDAGAERAVLVPVHDPPRLARLAALVAAAERWQREQPLLTAEVRAWTRPGTSRARDGIPARAYPARPAARPAALTQRDFDLGRGWGTLPATESDAPVATAVLTTRGDTPADWLQAGQALYRLLLRAAGAWVFASLHSQPVEIPRLRTAIGAELGLDGQPQMVLQFGRARIAALTGRRPITDLLIRP